MTLSLLLLCGPSLSESSDSMVFRGRFKAFGEALACLASESMMLDEVALVAARSSTPEVQS